MVIGDFRRIEVQLSELDQKYMEWPDYLFFPNALSKRALTMVDKKVFRTVCYREPLRLSLTYLASAEQMATSIERWFGALPMFEYELAYLFIVRHGMASHYTSFAIRK